MKNVLLLVHDDDGQEARLQAALDLVRAVDGHLTCVDVVQAPMMVGDLYSGIGDAIAIADEKQKEAENKAALTRRLNHEDVAWSWEDSDGDIVYRILEASMLADVIVLNRELDNFPYPDMHDIASRILVHSRKPVVAVPESLTRFGTERAFIAWDGQGSVASTMRACVPLLSLAKEVSIVTIVDGSVKADPAEAAAYLSRHGIQAEIQIIEDAPHAADQVIASEAARRQADYILMGAYGRGRLREIFGGVTKRMLADSKLPLVLAH